jgi:hypothetical protein
MKISWLISFLCGFLLASLLGVVVLLTFQYKKYYQHCGGIDKTIIINPFQIDEDSFESLYRQMQNALAEADSESAMCCAKEVLSYRGTYNERQRSSIFSDMNLFWEHTIKKDLKYSAAYELLGKSDSAMSCLRRVLKVTEKDFRNQQVDKRFFFLLTKKLGKAEAVLLLEKSLQHIQKSGKKYPYHELTYHIAGFEVGISEEYYDSLKRDSTFIKRKLYDIYALNMVKK